MELWQEELKHSVKTTSEILSFLKIKDIHQQFLEKSSFKVLVTKHFLSKMKIGDINDPLLQQIIPQKEENNSFQLTKDAVGDLKSFQKNGIIQKYKSRILIIFSPICATNCRYCFRRSFPYEEKSFSFKELKSIKLFLENNPNIKEVILSGGDPMMVSNQRLLTLFKMLNTIPHITRVRIHTRMTVFLPSRFNRNLLKIFQFLNKKIIIVSHINHPNELNLETAKIFNLLNIPQITLLNQSVLLRNINDNSNTLITLSEKLFSQNILPYYLNALDLVNGVEHFLTSKNKITNLLKEIRQELPGFLVPLYVKEIPNTPYKTPIFLD